MATYFEEEIATHKRLRELSKQPSARANNKIIGHVDDICTRFIAACPFVIIASRGADGRLDLSPSKTTPGRLGARVIAPIRVAFRHRNDVGTQDEGTFAAQWLAYALPCQRFANTLTGICA